MCPSSHDNIFVEIDVIACELELSEIYWFKQTSFYHFTDNFGQYVAKSFFKLDENGNPSPIRPIMAVRKKATRMIKKTQHLHFILEHIEQSSSPDSTIPTIRIRSTSFP